MQLLVTLMCYRSVATVKSERLCCRVSSEVMMLVVDVDILLIDSTWVGVDCCAQACIVVVFKRVENAGENDLRKGRGKVSKMVGGMVLGLRCMLSCAAMASESSNGRAIQ